VTALVVAVVGNSIAALVNSMSIAWLARSLRSPEPESRGRHEQ
jgi:hypothetical protein